MYEMAGHLAIFIYCNGGCLFHKDDMKRIILKCATAAILLSPLTCSAAGLIDGIESSCKELIKIFITSRGNAMCGFRKIDSDAWKIYSSARCQFFVDRPYIDLITNTVVSKRQNNIVVYGREAMCQSLEKQHQEMAERIDQYMAGVDESGQPKFLAKPRSMCLGVFEAGNYVEEFQACGISTPTERSKKVFSALGCRMIVTTDDTASVINDGRPLFESLVQKNGQDAFCKVAAPVLRKELDKFLGDAEAKISSSR